MEFFAGLGIGLRVDRSRSYGIGVCVQIIALPRAVGISVYLFIGIPDPYLVQRIPVVSFATASAALWVAEIYFRARLHHKITLPLGQVRFTAQRAAYPGIYVLGAAYRPSIFCGGGCLQGKYSDEPADAEMYDRIIKSFVYSFGFCYSTKSLAGIGSLFRDIDGDIAQKYEQNKIKYQTTLEELIDKLDEVSFMMG